MCGLAAVGAGEAAAANEGSRLAAGRRLGGLRGASVGDATECHGYAIQVHRGYVRERGRERSAHFSLGFPHCSLRITPYRLENA